MLVPPGKHGQAALQFANRFRLIFFRRFLEEEPVLAKRRLQSVESGRLGIVLGKEQPVHPAWVAALQEFQREYLLAAHLGDTIHQHLAG